MEIEYNWTRITCKYSSNGIWIKFKFTLLLSRSNRENSSELESGFVNGEMFKFAEYLNGYTQYHIRKYVI